MNSDEVESNKGEKEGTTIFVTSSVWKDLNDIKSGDGTNRYSSYNEVVDMLLKEHKAIVDMLLKEHKAKFIVT